MSTLLDDWALTFAAETGGSLTSCSYKGLPILRAAIGSSDPRHMSAFPMVPFIGRINKGKFRFDGRAYELPPNMPPEPHAIHGHGWQSAWTLSTELSTSSTSVSKPYAQLSHTHNGATGWPWAYEAKQMFSASGSALTVAMQLTNQSAQPMPAGLGWHPYFPKNGALIEADTTHVWTGAEGNIIGDSPRPLTPETDLRVARAVSDLALDHCFSTGSGRVKLTWPARGLSVLMTASSPLRHLTVYTPKAADYFCVEPVSHAPDAVNNTLPLKETGLQVLKAGETLSAKITLNVELA